MSSQLQSPNTSTNTAVERPEFQRTLQKAREFYQVDKNLSVSDREALKRAFNAPLICDPMFSIPGLIAGIQLPNYAKKYGYLGPARQTRGLSVFLGFFGLMLGGQLGTLVGYTYAESSLASNPNASKAFNMLLLYPPQLGRTYYGETAKDPAKAMPDPQRINWRKELMFPYNLVVHPSKQLDPSGVAGPDASRGKVPGQLPGRVPGPIPGRIPGPQPEVPLKNSQSSLDDSLDDPFEADEVVPEEPKEVVSAWDRIRLQRGGGGQPVQKQQPFNNNDSGVSRVDTQPSVDEFDRELELERQGGGIPDDFSESEKKWT